MKLTFYLAKHQDFSTLPSKPSWVQASPLAPSHLCLQLVDVRPQVLDDGQQEVKRALLPLLPSTTRFPPPTPGSSLPRSSRRTNCSPFTSTVLASPALLCGLFNWDLVYLDKQQILATVTFSKTHLGSPPSSLAELHIGVQLLLHILILPCDRKTLFRISRRVRWVSRWVHFHFHQHFFIVTSSMSSPRCARKPSLT